jgi:transcriptional regulator with XRE-family HTH domain
MPSRDRFGPLHTPRYRRFVELLKVARAQAGLTQAEVARRLGKPQSWVAKCEGRERRVDFVEAEDLAVTYGVPLSFFGTRRSRE